MKNYLINLLIKIKNGQLANKLFIIQNINKNYKKLLHILWNEGFIVGYKSFKNKLKIFLKYKNKKPVLKFLRFTLKSNFKNSIKYLWKFNSIKLFVLLSTNLGFKSIVVCKKLKLSGKPFFIIN